MIGDMSTVVRARALRMSEACIEYFFRHGTTRVNVDALAAAAGVSRRTFHRYFESKEASIRPVLEQGMELMARHLSGVAAEFGLVDAVVAAFAEAAGGRLSRRTHHLIPLLDETDAMRAVFSQAIADGERALTAPIAARLGVPDGSSDARVIAAVITTIVRVALLDAHARDADPVATFEDRLRRVGILHSSAAPDGARNSRGRTTEGETTMKAIRLHGANDARLDEVAEPELREGTVKIRISWAGICGSDLALFEHAPIPLDFENPIMHETGPKTLGHEFSGYVTEVADGVTGIKIGDLVAVQPNFADGTCPACLRGEPNLCENFAFIGINGWGGGFSEYVVAPADHVFVLPEGFSPEVGALVESLTVAWHAAKQSGAGEGSSALVIGAGPIGLGLLLSLRARGVSRVIISELSDSRKELARELGADVIDPREVDVTEYARSVTAGAGVDVSFDASGVGKPTLQPALDALRSGGRSVIVAQFHGEVPIDPNLFLTTEKGVVGSFAYTGEDFAEVIDAIADGRLEPEKLVSSRIPLEDAVDGGLKHLLGGGRQTEVKILVGSGATAA